MASGGDVFSGIWHCAYWYPSNDHSGEDISEYDMQMHQNGSELVLESLPNAEESYMLVRLSIDGDVATGTWHETTSPHGAFKGAVYSGAGQLIIGADKRRMEGKWAGIGFDHEQKRLSTYSGKWEIVHTGRKA